MSQTFLSLPRELRDKVYSEVLTASGVIYLSSPFRDPITNALLTKPRVKGRTTPFARRDGPEFLETALIYVNRQVSSEALETLYSTNTFCVPVPLSNFVYWLSHLPAKNRVCIRNLELVQRLFEPLLFDNTDAWSDLYHLISTTRHGGQAMHLSKVTVLMPLDYTFYEPSPALSLQKLMSNSMLFWWPALKFFAGLLVGSSDSDTAVDLPRSSSSHQPTPGPSLFLLVLRFPDLARRGIPSSHAPVLVSFDGDTPTVQPERLEAVNILRVPRFPGDTQAEAAVLSLLRQVRRRDRKTSSVWKDYHAREEIASRARLDFRACWFAGREGLELGMSNGRLRLDGRNRIRGEGYNVRAASDHARVEDDAQDESTAWDSYGDGVAS
jgi:hypothetical protein